MRDFYMLRAAALIGILASNTSRAQWEASRAKHAAKDPGHPHAGKDHPTFAQWLASEANAIAGAFNDMPEEG